MNAFPLRWTTLGTAALLALSATQVAAMGPSHSQRATGERQRMLASQARATYAADMRRCMTLAGSDRAVCVKEAQAVQAEALAAARHGHEIGDEDQVREGTEMRESDYPAALARCDAYMGEARDSCIAAVNARFGRR